MHVAGAPGVLLRLAALGAVLLGGAAVAAQVGLPSVDSLRATVESAGWAAPVAFVGIYALVTLAPLPKNVLSALAGLVFGLPLGIALTLLAAMIGATVAFVLGRVLGRAAVERFTGARVRRVDELLARRGLLAVVAVRLVPVVPFTAVNYGAGLTGVRTRDYLLGSVIGMLPGTVAYVALGAYGSVPGSWPFLVAAAALVVMSVGGVVLARRRSGREQVA